MMRKNIKLKAWILLLVFSYELLAPLKLMALTSGPAQPEMAAFTPAGVTEMVDPFTGDFTYNIPLMDVEGYPVNIAYNSGIGMEQEASWVGLGWNLNVGTVNRSVRGLPDDFAGEEITTTSHIKDMKITKFGGGLSKEFFGLEIGGFITKAVGIGQGSSTNVSFLYNNYKGFGIATDFSVGPNLGSPGMNINSRVGAGINTLDGASFNSSLGARLGTLSLNRSGGYNTRTGQNYLAFGTSASYGFGGINLSASAGYTYVPIGLETYTPYPTLQMESNSISYTASAGGETSTGTFINGNVHGAQTIQSIVDENKIDENDDVTDKKVKAYGYVYSEQASVNDLKDFNREKEISLNKTVTNLSPTSFTYDVYSVSGQGVAGSFRPFRNDLGILNDPLINSTNNDADETYSFEFGAGSILHFGGNVNKTDVITEYGPWQEAPLSSYQFKENTVGSPYEKVYFKAAGDLTESDMDYYGNIGEEEAIDFELKGMDLLSNLRQNIEEDPNNNLSARNSIKRQSRSKLFSYFTAAELDHPTLNHRSFQKIESHKGEMHDGPSGLVTTPLDRVTTHRKGHHISKIVQTSRDGERYVFGIPAYNTSKEEVSFNTNDAPDSKRRVITKEYDDMKTDPFPGDNFYQKKEIPAYAHSYLLTEKQSSDYQDITGDGVTEDDAGQAWKINYRRTTDNYTWRVPYEGSNFSEGLEIENKDQRATYAAGVKELWYVHSIVSKNQVAEFYISPRMDAVEANDDLNGGLPTFDEINADDYRTFKLDYIRLYDKTDRYEKKGDAIPLKTIHFEYDYSLCKNVENFKDIDPAIPDPDKGKLTLKKITISHGKNDIGELSPYQFSYSTNNNPDYDPNAMDRWGNYKDPASNPYDDGDSRDMRNDEYPYVTQDGTEADEDAKAWHISEIITPSGGKINIEFEADDYAYVQNQIAMRMFPISGATANTALNGNAIFPSSDENHLYGHPYLFIDLHPDFPKTYTDNELRQLFFNGKDTLEDLYFKFSVELRDDFEYVAGYVNAVDIGYEDVADPLARQRLWIRLTDSGPNPISKVSWGFLRENLIDKLYKRPDVKDGNIKALFKGLFAAVDDIRRMFTGVEDYLKNRDIADKFEVNKSFLRLYHPNKIKKGGGSRVAQISLNDNWSSMAADGTNATYGQIYEYTTEDELGNTISSGVASYEPIVGNEENPFRTPMPYISQEAKGHVPAIAAYQENPFGESFIPSPQVGYSKVKVKNLHHAIGKTANAITEHKFYTAKDFPVQFKETKIQVHDKPAGKPKMSWPFGSTTNKSEYAASQGYSIILNDMHGKPLSTETYTIQTDNTGEEFNKVVSGTEYSYFHEVTPDGKALKNNVQVLTDRGFMKESLLGVEYDIAIDSRRSYESFITVSSQRNFDLINVPLVPIPVPIITRISNEVNDIKESRIAVITKVIQKYGIISSVRNYTDQYEITNYNKLFNAHTGEALLIESEDEHNKKEFHFKVPAYLSPDLQRMGAAFENDQFVMELEEETEADCSGSGFYKNPGYLRHGDEVIVNGEHAWVDLNYQVDVNGTPEPNGKDPFFPRLDDPDCGNVWAFRLHHDGKYCSDNTNNYTSQYGNYSFLNLPKKDITLYLPKEEIADFLIDPIYDVNTYSSNMDALCGEFGLTLNGDPNFLRESNFSSGLGYTDHTTYNISSVFDMNNPITAEVLLDGNGKIDMNPEILVRVNHTNSRLVELLTNASTFSSGATSNQGFFLLKINNTTVSLQEEEVYFVGDMKRSISIPMTIDNTNITLPNPSLISGYDNLYAKVTPRCPNTFRLKSETGTIDPQGGVDCYLYPAEGSELKVIRSGNRNMLNAEGGSIVSALSSPIQPDADGKVQIKSTASTGPNYQVMQVTAQEYSDDYTVEDDNNLLCQTIANSDGKFRLKKTYTYHSERHQNSADVRTAEDGYLGFVPELWKPVDQDCGFMFIQTSQDGWEVAEEITKYDQFGNSLEARNAFLDIYSAVLTNNKGKVKMLASNAKYRNIAMEDFEEYLPEHNKKHFSLYHDDQFQDPLGNYIVPTNLIKGEAHTGNYSMFLQGANPDAPSDPILNYTEKMETSLIREELGVQAVGVPRTLADVEDNIDDTEYGNRRATYESNYSSISGALGANGTNVHSFLYDPTPDPLITVVPGSWNPDPNQYFFSIWVKEILPTGKAYYGESATIKVTTGGQTYTPTMKTERAIDGWYQISGTFDYAEDDDITIKLEGGLWGAFFDDFRLHPSESNVKTFVYDVYTERLKAQLDENNYATFFKYADDGTPMQIDRETAAGRVTISETRQSRHNQ